MKSLDELATMSIDEKIALALEELEALNRKRSTWWRRRRKDQLVFALEAWWMVKGRSRA